MHFQWLWVLDQCYFCQFHQFPTKFYIITHLLGEIFATFGFRRLFWLDFERQKTFFNRESKKRFNFKNMYLKKVFLPLKIRSQRTADFLHFFPFDKVIFFTKRIKRYVNSDKKYWKTRLSWENSSYFWSILSIWNQFWIHFVTMSYRQNMFQIIINFKTFLGISSGWMPHWYKAYGIWFLCYPMRPCS